MTTTFMPQPGRVSVTVLHDTSKSYGLKLAAAAGPTDDHDSVCIDMIATNHKNGLLKKCPLHEKDRLLTINNRSAHHFLDGDGHGYLKSSSFVHGQPVTFVAEPRGPSNNNEDQDNNNNNNHNPQALELDECDASIVRAFGRLSSVRSKEELLAKIGLCFHRVMIEDNQETTPLETNGSDSEEESLSRSSLSFGGSTITTSSSSSKSSSSSSFLQIDKIDPHGIFAHSVLNQGDIVLAINGLSTDEDTTVDQAEEYLSFGATKRDTIVDLLALNPRKLLQVRRQQQQQQHGGESLFDQRKRHERKQWMRKQVKRASVAIGGSALLGVGLVFHPAGGLCLTSGVSLLASEFEAPQRMVQSARDSLQQWTKDDQVQQVEASLELSRKIAMSGETKTDDYRRGRIRSMVHSESDRSSSIALSPLPPTSPPNKVTRAVKGFGLRYVLPLLDKMAGDPKNDFRQSEQDRDALSYDSDSHSEEQRQPPSSPLSSSSRK